MVLKIKVSIILGRPSVDRAERNPQINKEIAGHSKALYVQEEIETRLLNMPTLQEGKCHASPLARQGLTDAAGNSIAQPPGVGTRGRGTID